MCHLTCVIWNDSHEPPGSLHAWDASVRSSRHVVVGYNAWPRHEASSSTGDVVRPVSILSSRGNCHLGACNMYPGNTASNMFDFKMIFRNTGALAKRIEVLEARQRARPGPIGSGAPVGVLTGHGIIAAAARPPSGHALQHGRGARQRCSATGLGVLLLSPGARQCCCPTAERPVATQQERVCCLPQPCGGQPDAPPPRRMQSPSGACACSAPSASEVTRARRPGTQGRSRSRSAACTACRRPATAAGRVRILTSSRLSPACLRLAALCKKHSPRISAGAAGGDGSAARPAATDAAPAPGAAGTWGAPDAASARLQGGQGGHGAERGDPERRLRAEGARLGARSPATRRPPPPAASEPYAVWSRAAMRPAAPRQAAPRPRQGYASGARATRRARAAARPRPGRGRCLPYWATYARPCLRGGRRRARAPRGPGLATRPAAQPARRQALPRRPCLARPRGRAMLRAVGKQVRAQAMPGWVVARGGGARRAAGGPHGQALPVARGPRGVPGADAAPVGRGGLGCCGGGACRARCAGDGARPGRPQAAPAAAQPRPGWSGGGAGSAGSAGLAAGAAGASAAPFVPCRIH